MDVTALVPGRHHPSTRYRIEQFGAQLASDGFQLHIEPIEKSLVARLRQLGRARRDQVVIVQRKLLPVWQTWLLRRQTDTLIYDFDDAVFYRDSFHPRGPHSLTRSIRFHAMIESADLVIAGNRYLADHATRLVGARKVEVIPTCLDAGRYRPADHQDRRPTRLVWIGSSSTLQSLEAARPMLEEVGRSIRQLKLRVICDRFPSFQNVEIEPTPWDPAREGRDLGESDIGISWLPDDAWSRGKCGLKILQYMAAGLPVVASPVGVHREMVAADHGFLPTSPSAWIDNVTRLVQDAPLRQRMGFAGRRRIETTFDRHRWANVFADRIRAAVPCR